MWPFKKAEKAAPQRAPSDAPIQPQIVYMAGGSAFAIVKWSDQIAANSAMSHPVVYRALDKIASSVQQVAFYVKEDPSASASERRSSRAKMADLQSLLDAPNNDMTPAQFRYWMALNYAVYGRVPYKVSFSSTDTSKPNGIYPLDPAETFAVQNARGVIEKYEYGASDAKQSLPSRAKAGSGAAFADQIWRPGLRGYQYLGESNTPMNSIGLPAQMIRSLLARAIQTAEGHPNVKYIVTSSKAVTVSQVDRLSEVLNGDHGIDGPDSGKVPILSSIGDIEIHKVSNDLSDIHTKTPSDDMARIIFGAFGIPIALAGMGAADGAKYAGNYIESRASFWQDTIVPSYVEPLFQGLSRSLCPAGLKIVPDLDTIPAMLDGRVGAMSAMKDVDFLTQDEKRELFGFDQLRKEDDQNAQ